jgi:cobalamin biosynthesis Mg chelatase CobN
MSMKRHLAAGIALTVGLVALTGSALAAPPETPPGQEQKEEKQAEQAAPTATTAPVAATQSAPAAQNRGQEQKAANAQSANANAQSTNGINATTAGVKPSNDTDKSTWCETGGAGTSTTCTRNPHGTNPPDSSKRYGNGTTAARIATSRGAPAGTDVYGPGNSQPHKVCGKNGHFIDVHAVKSYVGITCSTTPQQQSQSSVTNTSTTSTGVTGSTNVTSSTTQTAATAGTAAAGGVAGVTAESGSPQSGSNGAAGGVLGAFGVAGVAAGGELPFTGFPLWLAILAAIALIGIGWTLHRTGRPATRDLV